MQIRFDQLIVWRVHFCKLLTFTQKLEKNMYLLPHKVGYTSYLSAELKLYIIKDEQRNA